MATLYDSIAEKAQELSGKVAEWRQQLHSHPELSYQEYRTSQFVADILKTIPGMAVETGVGYPTAVVGTLSAGVGPTIALRADMDALPIMEENQTPYRSQQEGVMHACGHDAHTSILLGVAHVLAERFERQELTGTVKFIFQPAEESTDENGLTGAVHMIRAGVLDGVDCAIALHMSPENPVGEIQVNAGYSMANVDVFDAKIFGTGGHGAYPHLGTDPIWMLGPVLQALHGIVSRKVSPLDAAVVSVGQIHAGSASNIIPSEVTVQGTLRSYTPEVREQLITEVEKVFSLVDILGGSYTFHAQRGEPALKNDETVNEWIKQTLQDLYPDCRLVHTPFGLGGEDFAYMAQRVPAAMFFLGCALPDGIKRELHTPIFDIDERCLPMGVTILAEIAKRFLEGQYQLKK
ncbi:M20 family metallopeptidase [Ammoniphilus sp. YIM 78166]|uniref:M20 metallopeptidase family protein n=1 Tax=Ammoniphilus sp. YIM 78166 TaxID=1644106 RepID=UPI00196A8C87|nr:amidohydrolase [Ammoniphilus sp. YIM 78166]